MDGGLGQHVLDPLGGRLDLPKAPDVLPRPSDLDGIVNAILGAAWRAVPEGDQPIAVVDDPFVAPLVGDLSDNGPVARSDHDDFRRRVQEL